MYSSKETLSIIREIGFSKIHIFPFSARRGTAAANMSGQISPQEKQIRSRHLAEVEQETRRQYFASLQGKKLQVLFESISTERNSLTGTSCRYAPVEVAAKQMGAVRDALGKLCTVEAKNVADDRILATTDLHVSKA